MAERTLAQRRAADALRKIDSVADSDPKEQKSYKSYVAGLPALIVMSGLGQALATLLSQSKGNKDSHRLLYDHLAQWLGRPDPEAPYPNAAKADTKHLMEEIMANSQDSYLHAQAEAMAYLEWLKKFAQAFLAGE